MKNYIKNIWIQIKGITKHFSSYIHKLKLKYNTFRRIKKLKKILRSNHECAVIKVVLYRCVGSHN